MHHHPEPVVTTAQGAVRGDQLTAFPVSDVHQMAIAAGADACLDKVNMATSLVPALRDLVIQKSIPAPRIGSDGPHEG